MKKIAITLIGLTILLASCGNGNTNVLNTTEGINSIKTMVNENFGDKEVYQLNLMAYPELSSDLGSIIVNYLDNGVDYSQMYSTQIPDKPLQDAKESSTQSEFFLKNKQGKKKVSEFDFSAIESNYQEAIKMIEGYENFQLYNWVFNVDNDNHVTSSFTVHATLVGEDSERSGRMEITNYYEFNFEVDKDGNLNFVE